MNSPSLSIIVPIYNESDVLPRVLPSIINYCSTHHYFLILVNDGSKDDSLSIIRKHSDDICFVTVVNHKLNRGYGGALKSGIKASNTEYSIFVDADGQHRMEDVSKLFTIIQDMDADMIVGSRKGHKGDWFRSIGKTLIRGIAKLLMNVPIYDINSGMKIFRTDIAKSYLSLYPDTMAFSDIICLVFLHNRHFVLEEPIKIEERQGGTSTIGVQTAINTVYEIVNIVTMFNPMKIFFPVSMTFFMIGIPWGIYLLVLGNGLSVGSSFLIMGGIISLLLGLLAEQIAQLRLTAIDTTKHE